MKRYRTEFDYRRLLGRIREKCQTQALFAEQIGISRTSLNKRLNNLLDFSQDEILKACRILEIDFNEIPVYFFALKV